MRILNRCGCLIEYEVNESSGYRIVHCSKHDAAPDLLAACKEALPVLQAYNATLSVIDTVEAAIEKAEQS